MASAPASAPANAENDRNAALTALALLLANTKQRYSLPAMIAAQKIRPGRMRMIRTTNALASNMAAPHFMIVNAWAAALPEILAAVPLGRAAVAAAIDHAAARIPTSHAKAMVPHAVDTVERYHRAQWVSRVKAATGLDVSMLTQPGDVADPVQATTVWSQALTEDVHSQVKGKLMAALMVAGFLQADAKAKADDVIAKARARAAGIGADQTVKLSRSMDRDRAAAAGLDEWIWRHLDPQPHPRVEHQRRDGRVYSKDNPPDTMPGEEPFCHCWGEPKLA